ncbi:Nn.00g072480.m01.CDS01 [Neocucurbitaria sp. VM-36]
MQGRPSKVGQELFARGFKFALVRADKSVEKEHVSDVIKGASLRLGQLPETNNPWSSNMRVALARSLVHLTLRLGHTDWWTWTDDPSVTEGNKQLGIDPIVGDGSAYDHIRPTSDRMQYLASERRTGHNPTTVQNTAQSSTRGSAWGSVIGQLPDLKSLELVLETFAEKKGQLEKVIECAKLWRFPIDGTQHELIWDGQVETARWSRAHTNVSELIQDARWYDTCTDFEVRIVRFIRKRAA